VVLLALAAITTGCGRAGQVPDARDQGGVVQPAPETPAGSPSGAAAPALAGPASPASRGIPGLTGTFYGESQGYEFIEVQVGGKNMIVAKGEIDIKYRTGVTASRRDAILKSSGLRLRYRDSRWDWVYLVDGAADFVVTIGKLKRLPEVEAAEPNRADDPTWQLVQANNSRGPGAEAPMLTSVRMEAHAALIGATLVPWRGGSVYALPGQLVVAYPF